MREIKFRAWDKKAKKMINHDKLFRLDTSNEYPFLPLLNNMYSQSIYPLDVEIMQYIGLNDNKRTKEYPEGQEIYEDDICLVSLKYFDIKNEKAKVIFKDGCFCFQFGFSNNYVKTYKAWDVDSIEVIGNIHDNPELFNNEI